MRAGEPIEEQILFRLMLIPIAQWECAAINRIRRRLAHTRLPGHPDHQAGGYR